MQLNSSRLIGNSLEATNGEIGKVVDFYFDDQAWVIVYVVVNTGGWLVDHMVLLSSYYLQKVMSSFGTFQANLTKEEIRSCPDISTSMLVYQQPQLRSTLAMSHYRIETTDSQVGKLIDLIIDDKTWHIEYLLIEMQSCLMGKKVLVAFKQVKYVRWDLSLVMVDITSSMLKTCPSYDPSEFSLQVLEH